ncbi:metal-binding protein [Methanoplanus sp. FWC-SCC4]|uniref:Metal-binding protein n=1 Tax=Methanochimaera problematica TaxID=2609417 RepID=A0AA97I3G0_9EURY|nr:UPF0058 family protein [Methanoplanus sp. FWC-SCC4]WOF15851.1 metal-binding protein [Methanoplanus sp. FWC-SCC4]
MQKEELLHLHMLLVQVKKYYESVNNEEIVTEKYDQLNISPVHIHKNKICHKEAILTLGEELVGYIQNGHAPSVEYTSGTVSEEVAVEN